MWHECSISVNQTGLPCGLEAVLRENRRMLWDPLPAPISGPLVGPDVRGGVARVVFRVTPRRGDSRNRGDPGLLQELLRVAVSGGQRPPFGVIQRRQVAVLDDRELFPLLRGQLVGGEAEVDVDVAVGDPPAARPALAGAQDPGADPHVDDAGAETLADRAP